MGFNTEAIALHPSVSLFDVYCINCTLQIQQENVNAKILIMFWTMIWTTTRDIAMHRGQDPNKQQ